jgi:hypothetical protein
MRVAASLRNAFLSSISAGWDATLNFDEYLAALNISAYLFGLGL